MRIALGADYQLFIGAVAAFIVVLIAIGAAILNLFSPSPSQGQALSTPEQFVPVNKTRDWRGAFLNDKL